MDNLLPSPSLSAEVVQQLSFAKHGRELVVELVQRLSGQNFNKLSRLRLRDRVLLERQFHLVTLLCMFRSILYYIILYVLATLLCMCHSILYYITLYSYTI